jgi:hypothetical protein
VRQADSLDAGQLAAEGVKLELGLERVPAEIIQGIPRRGTRIGVLVEEFASALLEVLGWDEPEAHASSVSSARISVSDGELARDQAREEDVLGLCESC